MNSSVVMMKNNELVSGCIFCMFFAYSPAIHKRDQLLPLKVCRDRLTIFLADNRGSHPSDPTKYRVLPYATDIQFTHRAAT